MTIAVNDIRPAWEGDPNSYSPGRAFETAWLIGDVEGSECFVYEVFEKDKRSRYAAPHPVYVGISRSFPARWGEHRSHSWWFERMEPLCVIVSGYRTRADALKVEALLISEHRPIFNRKPERAHLAMAREAPPAEPLFSAELTVRSGDGT